VYEKKGAQDAHEAIRPVNIDLTPDFVSKYLSQDETKLYELIWKRFVASQMKPAEYFLKQVTIEGGKFMFRATGSTLIFDGFLKVYLVEEDNEEESVKIPKEIKEQDKLNLKKLDPKQHFTQPPARYTEATLVKELEKRGIGRPSTYAAILSTIQKRGYTSKEVKRFVPTELGKAVTNMLVKNLPDIINVSFTALMEEDLDKIEKGEIKRDSVLNTFYEKFSEDLEAFGEQEKGKIALKIDLACPKCKSSLLIRFGKGGEFAGCSKFPECKFTSNFTRDAQGKITLENTNGTQELSLKCPQCSKTLVKKMGRFGPFIACPGYPECKYIHQETLKVPCPSCGSKLVKRRWRGGNFWGCAKYPECKFAIFGEVAEIKCPNCKSPYLLVSKNKSGEIVHTCPNKECGYKENIVSDA
jgi:DNA topoisomerase-1